MTRSLLPLLFLAAAASAAEPSDRSPNDIFGRPRPHGEPIEKAFVGLYTGRTDLFFGQPISVELFAIPATPDGPYVHPHLSETGTSNVKLTLTDDAGKPVPFVLELGGSSSSGQGEFIRFSLKPTKAHSAGGYWTPNQYTLTATVDNPDEPTSPKTIPGKFVSNKLKFIVRAASAARNAADPEQPLNTGPFAGFGHEAWLHIAGLDDKARAAMRAKAGFGDDAWDCALAGYDVVRVPQDKPLTKELAKQLLADLGSKMGGARVRAMRNVPPGAGDEIHVALVALLADDTKQTVNGGFQQYTVFPIRVAAAEALVRLGSEVTPAVLAFAKDEKNVELRADCVRVLGRLGHHPDAEKWLRALLDSGNDDWQYAVQGAAAKWGTNGVALSRAVMAHPKLRKEIKRDAIEALGKFGDLTTDAPALRPLLKNPAKGQQWDVQWSAVRALCDLKDVASLPEFARIARDNTVDQNVRYPAVDMVLALGKKDEAEALLLELMKRRDDRLQAFAMLRAGARKQMAALPVALDALDGQDWYTRVMADYALRGLANDRAGVGYDPGKPGSQAWRDFWAKKGKK